jgi:hypothetical protein
MPIEKSPLPFKFAFQDTARMLLGGVLLIIVGIAIVAAVMASSESQRFDKGVAQIIAIVSSTRSYAAVQSGFAQQAGEDMLATLVRVGQIPSTAAVTGGKTVQVTNIWDGAVRAVVVSPSVLRIESVQPASACRRMALLMISSATAFGLQRLEVVPAGVASPTWAQAYSEDALPKSRDDVEATCGEWGDTVLAAQFHVR